MTTTKRTHTPIIGRPMIGEENEKKMTKTEQNRQTFWGKVIKKPTLETTRDGKFSWFLFELKRPIYKGKLQDEEITTMKCIAFKDRAEDLNMMLEKGDKGWIKGYFKNDKDKSLTFVVGDFGKL